MTSTEFKEKYPQYKNLDKDGKLIRVGEVPLDIPEGKQLVGYSCVI